MSSIQFLGAAGEVTGSSYLVNTGEINFLVDCGLFQGTKQNDAHNYADFSFDPSQINFVILTHAHLDHCGLLPRLYREGFRGVIHATPATIELAKLILTDAAQIQENGANDYQLEVLFTHDDVAGCLQLFKSHKYKEKFMPTKGVSACFHDAGHILGSAMVEVWLPDKKIVFSGDIGNSPVPILQNPTVLTEADYVVCESTYGDRLHSSATKRDSELLRIIRHAKKHHAKVIIPSFALERSQDLLYCLNNLKNQRQLPDIPVYLDSPLAIKITKIYQKYSYLFDAEFQKLMATDKDLFSFSGFQSTLSPMESRELNNLNGEAIYIAGSGMADAGRVQHHLLHHLSDPTTQVIFVGFCAPGTLGRRLLDGMTRVIIRDKRVTVRAQIHLIDSFSAHADQKGIMSWLKPFKTPAGAKPTIFLTHGESPARTVLAGKIETQLKAQVLTPMYRQKYEL